MNAHATLRSLARTAGVLCIMVLAYLALVPGSDKPHVLGDGDVEHFVAYCGTSLLLALGFRRRFAWVYAAVLSGGAAFFEVAQVWIPGRSAGIDNWLAGTIGAYAGVVLAVFAVQLIARRFPEHPFQ